MRSAKKRMRQDVKRRARNRWRKGRIKEAVRAFDQAVHEGSRERAAERLREVYKQLDQVAAKGSIHKNAASRRKARLARRLNRMGE
jgi:small subunit ribosomal protein S20